ncbi:MAG TPA: hypothetical protein VJ506_01250, partial [Candidatus Limnocylindrales bacterium]|nr:hypothetical protein [Candidatus Limnocylindrales bacterium]
MTAIPRAILAVDAGAATTAVAVIGRPAERWRLLGSIAAPAPASPDDLGALLLARIAAADPELAAAVGVTDREVNDLPRLESRSEPPGELAVLGGSRRAVGLLGDVAARTPWRVTTASVESHDPREMTDLVLRPRIDAVLVGAGEPPGPDERPALDDLAGLVAAAARRRPELRVVIAGNLRSRRTWAEGLGEALEGAADRVVEAPALGGRSAPDVFLRELLEGLLPRGGGTRQTAVRALVSLADVLDRRVELLEIGLDGGLRAVATPGLADEGPSADAVRSAAAALVPPEPDDAATEAVLAWTTGSLDRHRMGDRLRDLRAQPWADASGEGARLRLAAARAALGRLVDATPDLGSLPAPDLTLVAGGAFAAAPGGAIVLAVADVVRRTGATQVGFDHARLLGPLGTIEDPDERRDIVADLADDLIAPLGTLLVAAGMPPRLRGRAATGTITLDGDGSGSDGDGGTGPGASGFETLCRELATGELALVPLGPGRRATATLEFRD